MKTNPALRFNIFLVFLLILEVGIGKTLEEKRRVIDKTFQVTDNVTLQVINSFGKVHLNTWSRPQIKVQVEIIARARSEERAERIMEKIDVAIGEGSSLVSLETKLPSNMNGKGEESFEINYMISAPPKNPIRIENKFGDTFLARREGEAAIRVGYGSLKTEGIQGFLDLSLSFGNGNIGKTTNSKIEVKYSDLFIDSGNEMDMEQQFSDVEINAVKDLDLESKYGDVEIGKVDVIETDAQFSGFSINELTGSLYMEASYVSEFEIGKLYKTFKSVEIHGKFSSYEINLEEGLKADFEGEFSFSNMSSGSREIDLYYQVKDGNRREYKARIGGGDLSKKIVVKSSYGDLRLR